MTTQQAEQAQPGRTPGQRQGPLSHIRVADFCWMGVGSVATRLLADFGAQVIKIEDRNRLDTPRRLPIYKGDLRSYGDEDANPDPDKGGLFNNYCRNKLGVTINMKSDSGRALAERLISSSSVVTENFAPGVMERWGLTYDRLRELREDVIFARMSGYGHSGPHHEYRSYGPVIQAVSGMSFISGLPDREPSGWGLSYMDNQAAYYNSAALLMAIFHRQRTGQGMEVDASAVEIGISLLGPDLLDTLVNQRPSRRPGFPRGNRSAHEDVAPHGVYPTAGEDQWVAITVADDAEWQRLVAAMGRPAWADEQRFATGTSRREHEDDLDKLMSGWTSGLGKHAITELLQAASVTAGAVQDPRDLDEVDPQIAARGTFFDLDHPVIGPARFEGTPISFSETVQENWRSAPLLGEDNHYVFGEVLGLSETELAELEAEGAI
ncbi:carnitine dehydratase [Nocardioides sp. Root190]|uniref:CaiB/BaiF CoA transferase family protein n=1 Tax=Nocardioides sp. Root190 TaxID=1736488 RepID=UPI0006F61E56|nr:CoA transferase [Nocardioides sp. Root190]KRB76356.1 carnitine dehydratase [Nocardioides sp. Root190]